MAGETDLGSVIPLYSINCFQLQTSKDSSPQPCLKKKGRLRSQENSKSPIFSHYSIISSSLWEWDDGIKCQKLYMV